MDIEKRLVFQLYSSGSMSVLLFYELAMRVDIDDGVFSYFIQYVCDGIERHYSVKMYGLDFAERILRGETKML